MIDEIQYSLLFANCSQVFVCVSFQNVAAMRITRQNCCTIDVLRIFNQHTLRERTISILSSENIFSVVQQFNLKKIFIITIYMLHIMRIYLCFLSVKCFLDFFALQEERRLYVTSLIVEFTNILPLSQYFQILYYCTLGYANIILPEDGVVILQKY